MLRESSALRLIGTPGVTGLRREHSPLSAHSLQTGRLHNPRFLDNEKTALSGCFFEEFSYENVNLYKGKLADSISFDFSPPMSLFLLMMLVYRRNMSEVCRFSKTFLKKLKRFLEFFNTSLYFIYIFPCHVFFIHLYTDISTFLPCSPLCKILMLQIPLQKIPAQLNHPLISGTVLEHNRSPLCIIR